MDIYVSKNEEKNKIREKKDFFTVVKLKMLTLRMSRRTSRSVA